MLLWFDRSGKQIGQTGSPGDYATIGLSPDGTRLVASIGFSGIWVFDLARGTKTRLTLNPSTNGQPSWSPDGRFIVFFSDRNGGQRHIYQMAADGTGSSIPVVMDAASEGYPEWSADGRYLLFERRADQPNALSEIWALALFGDRKARPVLQSPFNLHWQALSPNGKWLAYVSPESGREEVYVAPFLDGNGKWLVSTGGGTRPRWRRDGRELFYLSADNRLMSVPVAGDSARLVLGAVKPLFTVSLSATFGRLYGVSADGKKFVVVTQAGGREGEPLTVVVNWPSLLNKR